MRLRIISGLFKGRFISAPDFKGTRPTTDRVKETLFNILNNEFDMDGAKVLDVYAGSGSLGFEALSRGASHISFIEKNSTVVNNLKKNISDLGVGELCTIYRSEASRFLSNYKSNFDLILADPPFFEYDIYEVVNIVKEEKILNHDGMMLIERSIQTKEKDIQNLQMEPFKKIGDTLLYKFISP
jgi:16S rRNA (guanine966-N2)-methyltransferase